MIQTSEGDREDMKEAKLPGRDWILLPAISLMTICGILASAECIARRMFTESKTGVERCMVFNDPSTGARGLPDSVCWEKKYENEPVEYRFNGSGFRADVEFGPKPPNTYRIVMVGSSVAMGAEVQREETFSALLPAELSGQTGRRVEIYNESMEAWGGTPHNIALRFNQVLLAEPDMVLWILTPGDIGRVAEVLPSAEFHPMRSISLPERAWQFTKAAFATKPPMVAMADLFGRTRTATLLLHFLYRSQSLYVKSSLMGDDRDAMRPGAESSREQQHHLDEFNNYAADIQARANVAGVPLVAVFLPDGQLAALISKGGWPAGYDPYKLDNELRSIIVNHGGIYLDILPDYRNIPNPEHGYFPVDGHPNADGHATIAEMLAKALTNGAVPALKAVVQPQAAKEQGR
jgi:hypothetical protein